MPPFREGPWGGAATWAWEHSLRDMVQSTKTEIPHLSGPQWHSHMAKAQNAPSKWVKIRQEKWNVPGNPQWGRAWRCEEWLTSECGVGLGSATGRERWLHGGLLTYVCECWQGTISYSTHWSPPCAGPCMGCWGHIESPWASGAQVYRGERHEHRQR